MYSVLEYGEMILDKGRMDPYVAALRQTINSNSIVMDIGTGTGVFALLACQFGAKHVYAIETNDAIQVGRELAVANGFSDRITFIQDLSSKIDLPEKADVIISDLRGSLPFCSHHIPSIIDARERHLAPGGILIPLQDEMRIALVNAPTLYAHQSSPWNSNDSDIDMSVALQWIKNTIWSSTTKEITEQFTAGEPKCWQTLDYYTITSPNVSAEINWQLEQDATVHGFRVWFDALLAGNIGFSSDPEQVESVYGNSFFPFQEAINLKRDDTISILLKAYLIGDDYVWCWDTKISNSSNPDDVRVEYKQSSFNGKPLSLTQLRKRAGSHKADLNEDGLIKLEILTMMDKGFLLNDIALALADKYPEKYTNWQQALADVGTTSVKYSK